MKKISILRVLFIILIASCKKDDKSLFDSTADQRINDTLNAYQSILVGAENGWNALLTTDSGRGATFSFYFKFNDQNRVRMVSDFDSASAAIPKESSYRLKSLQQPSLIFDTYSYLHVLADPDASQNGGVYGAGLLSDFEFVFSKVSADTITLTGRLHGSKCVLVRATKQESDGYLNGQFVPFSNFIDKILTYYKRLTLQGQAYDIKVTQLNRTITFSWLSGGNLQTFTTSYYNVFGGIILISPFVVGNNTISSFSNAVFDAANNRITLTAGTQQGTITSTVFPLKLDQGAAQRWYQYGISNDTYWISAKGFHVNGVDDAYNIQSLTRYYYLIYWPGYGNGNDLFAPVFINTEGTSLELQYGAAPATPTFSGGIAKFRLLGVYGDYPTTGPAAETLNQLLISQGYYFVQTSPTTYDMVSAADGKAWVSWEF